MATLDATTLAEYVAEVNASDRAQVIVDALTSTVYGRVYDSEDNVMGEGTMSSPWATVSGDSVIPATLNGFYVASLGSVNDGWYFKFESGSRYVRCSFGLVGSGKEAEWSLSTWDVGTQAGIINGAITVSGNGPPLWTGAPTALTFTEGTGGTSNFSSYASDPDGDSLTYSLVGTAYTGISIGSISGVLTVTSSAVAATRSLTARVTDSSGLYADHSVSVLILESSLPTIKWHPGHYVKTQGTASQTNQDAYWSGVLGYYSRIDDSPYLRGAYVDIAWGAFNPTGAAYDWSRIDAALNALDPYNGRLLLAVGYKNFTTSAGLICPSDLAAAHTYSTSSGWITAVWRSAVMDRFISAMQALAARYDNDPRLELVTWSESAPSWAAVTPPADYSNLALSTQIQRLATSASAAFAQTNVFINVNSLSGQLTQIIETGYQNACGFGTPDAVDTNAIRLFRGETVSGEQVPPRDYRGLMPHHEVASQPTLGGKDDNGPPSNIINWAQANSVTHLSWVTTVSTSPNTWAEILTAIAADPNLSVTCPTVYGGTCSSI